MRIGIRAHDFGRLSPNDLKTKLDQFGFDGVQLVFSKAFDKPYDDLEVLESLKDRIMMLGSYFNMVHPDSSVVETGLKQFKGMLDKADQYGVDFVGSETGSLMGSPWGYVKENHDDTTFQKVCEVVKELILHSEQTQSYVTIEGAYNHVVYSPKRMHQLIETINHPKLKIIVDIYNYLHINNHQNHVELLKECLILFKEHIVIFHLKDYVVIGDQLKQVGLGQGLMDYKTMIPLIMKHCPNCYLIFEGVVGDDIQSSMDFIKSIIK